MLPSEITNQQHPLIPNEAFRSFPLANEIKTGPNRKLFLGGIEPDEYEKKKLAEFDQFLKKKKVPLPPFWIPMQRIRFLQSCGYSFDRSYKEMMEHSGWMDRALPPMLTEKTLQYLKTGMFYVCGRDSRLRPILVFDIQKIVDTKAPPQQLMDTITYFFIYLINNMLIDGQIETWVSIIDVNLLGLFSFAGDLKKVVGFLSHTFRCRMHSAYIVRTPASVGFLWSIVKRFMEEDTIKKISLYDTDKRAEPLFEQANPSQIEKKFGGQLQNMTVFWPPRILSTHYEHNGSGQLLVSKEEYKRKYDAGELKDRKIDYSMIHTAQSAKHKEHMKLHHLQSSRQHLIERTSQNSPRQSQKFDSDSKIREATSKVNIPTPPTPLLKPVKIDMVSDSVIQQEDHTEQSIVTHIHKTRMMASSVRPVGEGLFIATPQTAHQNFGSYYQQDASRSTERQNQMPDSKRSLRSVRGNEAPSPTTNDILLQQKLLEIKSIMPRHASHYFS